jgi:hypothetical protein
MKRFVKAARGASIAVSLLALMQGGAQANPAGPHSAGPHPAEPNMENFTGAIKNYLAERGRLCLGKFDWPITVTVADQASKARDAVQMPVLEKLGLVKGEDGTMNLVDARRYTLTDEGKKYYIHSPVVVATATKSVTHEADFCVATLTLDKVVGWENPQTQDGQTRTSVLFTYKIDPAPFTKNADFQRVFPMVTRVVQGAGTMQLREGVQLTKDGWVAEELFKR